MIYVDIEYKNYKRMVDEMKVKMMARFCGKEIEEIIEIKEDTLIGSGYMPRNTLNKIVSDWAIEKLSTEYQILEDERFENGEDNMPYIDYVTARKLGWRNK